MVDKKPKIWTTYPPPLVVCEQPTPNALLALKVAWSQKVFHFGSNLKKKGAKSHSWALSAKKYWEEWFGIFFRVSQIENLFEIKPLLFSLHFVNLYEIISLPFFMTSDFVHGGE